MEMVIVEIAVPAIGEKFDFKLPTSVKIREIIPELARILEMTKGNVQFDVDSAILCDLDHARVLNPNLTAANQQITDGTCLQLL